jgi:teichuronic acid biosynthesis glycosyltransferase TuaC
LGLSEKGRVLVSVGHLSPRKGFHRVIRSMPRIIRSCPDARLVVVGGPGAERDNSAELKALVQRLGLADRVLFVGSQTPDRVAQWLGAADIFVLASDFEGCPNVILEAMACGRPIVATKVGDIERMVPEFAGLLVDDPEDEEALATCIIQVLRRDWETGRIRDHVAKESWDGVAKRVLAQWHIAVTSAGARDGHASAITSGKPVRANPEP